MVNLFTIYNLTVDFSSICSIAATPTLCTNLFPTWREIRTQRHYLPSPRLRTCCSSGTVRDDLWFWISCNSQINKISYRKTKLFWVSSKWAGLRSRIVATWVTSKHYDAFLLHPWSVHLLQNNKDHTECKIIFVEGVANYFSYIF